MPLPTCDVCGKTPQWEVTFDDTTVYRMCQACLPKDVKDENMVELEIDEIYGLTTHNGVDI